MLSHERLLEVLKYDPESGTFNKGVSWSKKQNRWEARIMRDRKNIVIGYFDSAIAAHEAWKRKAQEIHGKFARAS